MPAQTRKQHAAQHLLRIARRAAFETTRGAMIFFYEQGGQYMPCELLPVADGACELETTPEGQQTVGILEGSADVTRRMAELQQSLANAGWWGPIGRGI